MKKKLGTFRKAAVLDKLVCVIDLLAGTAELLDSYATWDEAEERVHQMNSDYDPGPAIVHATMCKDDFLALEDAD